MKFYRRGTFYFTLILFGVFLLLFTVALGYDKQTRLVPLVILAPALAMTAYCLAGEFFPRLLSRLNVNLIPLEEAAETGITRPTGHIHGRKGLVIVNIWLAVFFMMTLLAGFLISIPVALLSFTRLFAGQGWRRSLALTAITWAVIYGVFELLMRYQLFRGILFGEIVLF